MIPRPTATALLLLPVLSVLSFSAKPVVHFSKYHGLGNDFILIDNLSQTTPSLTPEQAQKLCHRNFGVGGDGVIFALQATTDHHDVQMRIFNSDGSEPEMCGNGIRCLAQFLYDKQKDNNNNSMNNQKQPLSYQIQTLAGTIVPVMNPESNTITVDMGAPIFEAARIPTTLQPNQEDGAVIQQRMTTIDGKEWLVSAVSMGNPHAVIFVQDLENDIEFSKDGPVIEAATDIFPAKTNVEFVQVVSPTHLKMKVWERGAGPTLACGTGACALTVAAIRAGKIPPNENSPTRVTLPGGDLFIEWKQQENKVYMTGPATFAFDGTAHL